MSPRVSSVIGMNWLRRRPSPGFTAPMVLGPRRRSPFDAGLLEDLDPWNGQIGEVARRCGAKGNPVSPRDREPEGAIGYVNQSFIKDNVTAAAVQNKSGEFVLPSEASGAKALNGIVLDENLAGKNPNPDAKGAYPIATLTWVLAYKEGNGDKAEAVQSVFNHMLSDASQSKASTLGFVRVLAKAKEAVTKIGE